MVHTKFRIIPYSLRGMGEIIYSNMKWPAIVMSFKISLMVGTCIFIKSFNYLNIYYTYLYLGTYIEYNIMPSQYSYHPTEETNTGTNMQIFSGRGLRAMKFYSLDL